MLNRCNRCLYPDTTQPYIHFDDDGICSGCRVAEEKEKIEWDIRWLNLKSLVNKHKGFLEKVEEKINDPAPQVKQYAKGK